MLDLLRPGVTKRKKKKTVATSEVLEPLKARLLDERKDVMIEIPDFFLRLDLL